MSNALDYLLDRLKAHAICPPWLPDETKCDRAGCDWAEEHRLLCWESFRRHILLASKEPQP